MKKTLLLFLLIPSLLYSQNTQWVKSFGGTAFDKGIYFLEIATDYRVINKKLILQ